MPTISKIIYMALAAGTLACAAPITEDNPQGPAAMNQPGESVHLEPQLRAQVESLLPTISTIPAERRATLDRVAAFVRERRAAGQPVALLFVCTHNSRRSHMSQVWAAVAAAWYGIDGVETLSAGTEATAFNPRAVAALSRAGFAITASDPDADNPRYEVAYASDRPPLLAYSKTLDELGEQREGFAAIMNCSEADRACPFVRGAALRISLPYEDPKQADGTAEEATRYDERSRQIAAEMLYLFAQVAE